MDNATRQPQRTTQVLQLPVTPETVIVVDAVRSLSNESLVAAALKVWPVLREVVDSALVTLSSSVQPTPYWLDRPEVTGLSPGAVALMRRVIDCLGADRGDGRATNQVDSPVSNRAFLVLASAAAVVDAIGPATWVCPTIPWPVRLDGQDVNTLASLSTDVARLCLGAVFHTNAAVDAHITRECAALMACLGAFSAGMPTLGRLTAQGCAETCQTGALTLRLLVITPATEAVDTVAVIAFDIDDQSPEDLAIGLDHIRDAPGVLSATVAITTGKKGRMSFKVEVLAQSPQVQDVIQCCLAQTTTIGLRWHVAQRATLPRTSRIVQGARGVAGGVKTALRPGGQFSSKVEADVLAASGLDLVGRSRLRIDLEASDTE